MVLSKNMKTDEIYYYVDFQYKNFRGGTEGTACGMIVYECQFVAIYYDMTQEELNALGFEGSKKRGHRRPVMKVLSVRHYNVDQDLINRDEHITADPVNVFRDLKDLPERMRNRFLEGLMGL